MFKDTKQQMPLAPDTNKIFVPKAAPQAPDEVYSKFVSTIDKTLLD